MPLTRRALLISLAAPNTLRAGAATANISPALGASLAGGMTDRKCTDIHDELLVRCAALESGSTRMLLATIDSCMVPRTVLDKVRARIARENSIGPEFILMSSTHTHSAPDCYAFPDGSGGHTGELAYMEWVCALAAEAINEAIDAAQPAHLKIGTGEAQGKLAYNYYAPDLYDRRLSVIQALTATGKTIATLVNYAIHPEVLGNEVGILSPDLCGPLCERLEERAGGMAIFMNSAQGGMVTADNRLLDQPKDAQKGYWEDARTWDECLRIGKTMADEALRIVSGAPRQESPSLLCRSRQVTFPVQGQDYDVRLSTLVDPSL